MTLGEGRRPRLMSAVKITDAPRGAIVSIPEANESWCPLRKPLAGGDGSPIVPPGLAPCFSRRSLTCGRGYPAHLLPRASPVTPGWHELKVTLKSGPRRHPHPSGISRSVAPARDPVY